MAELQSVFKFCPRCAGRLRWESRKHVARCIQCKNEFYDQPKVVVTAILKNGRGDILLGRRNRAPHKNKWCTLGGFVDSKESAEDAIRREIHEELGVRLGKLKLLSTIPLVYPYQGIDLSLLEIVFEARMPNELVAVDEDEIAELRYFPVGKIPYKNLAFESQRRTLQAYARAKNRGK